MNEKQFLVLLTDEEKQILADFSKKMNLKSRADAIRLLIKIANQITISSDDDNCLIVAANGNSVTLVKPHNDIMLVSKDCNSAIEEIDISICYKLGKVTTNAKMLNNIL